MGIKEIRRLDIKADKQLLKLRSIQAELCIAISEIVDCPYEPYVDVFASDGHCFCFDVGGVTAPYTIPIPHILDMYEKLGRKITIDELKYLGI